MHEFQAITAALFLSLIIWTLEGTTLYLIARAFPIPFNYPQAFFLLFFLGLSVTLPQAPGYVGTLELFGVTALGLLGISKESALPVILTIHGCQFGFVTVLGLLALWREGLSMRELVTSAEGEKP
jgi:glycosyltransferase 2 family protein